MNKINLMLIFPFFRFLLVLRYFELIFITFLYNITSFFFQNWLSHNGVYIKYCIFKIFQIFNIVSTHFKESTETKFVCSPVDLFKKIIFELWIFTHFTYFHTKLSDITYVYLKNYTIYIFCILDKVSTHFKELTGKKCSPVDSQ
jgi:hypothetical protein